MFDYDFWLLFRPASGLFFFKNSRKPENKKEVALFS